MPRPPGRRPARARRAPTHTSPFRKYSKTQWLAADAKGRDGVLDSVPVAPYHLSQLPEGARVSDPDDSERLKQLSDRIAKLRGDSARRPHQEEHYSQAQHAWRMVIELVAGLMIGVGIGYGLDSLFGTLPILLVVFTMLGLAAGIKTMMRSAAEMQKDQEASRADADEGAKDGD